jgi:hypothetical protein
MLSLSQYEIVLRDHFQFRKNLEQRDWAFVAHHVGERRRNGKESNVYLNGKLLERKRIQRGIRRYSGKGSANHKTRKSDDRPIRDNVLKRYSEIFRSTPFQTVQNFHQNAIS